MLSEAERVLAREKRRVKDNVLFMEKWYPEVGCFCTGTNINEAWVRVLGLPLHFWSHEVFKLIGDGCGGFIAVDENIDSMAELQWARSLVKVVGRDLPTSVQIGVGARCFLVHLWWESLPWFSQVVLAGSIHGEGVPVDEEEAGRRPRVVGSGRVLEKEVQSKVQTGLQVVPPCGSSSKSAIGFSSDYFAGGSSPEVIDGEESLKNRGQGARGVAKVSGHGFGPDLWEAQNRSGLGEGFHETALMEAALQGMDSEPRSILLKEWVVGCEERPFFLKGSLVGCEGFSEMGFGPGIGGLKGDKALFSLAVAEMGFRGGFVLSS